MTRFFIWVSICCIDAFVVSGFLRTIDTLVCVGLFSLIDTLLASGLLLTIGALFAIVILISCGALRFWFDTGIGALNVVDLLRSYWHAPSCCVGKGS